jgi:hypothetical protein
MSLIHDFVAGLARARKSFQETQETTKAAYGDKAMKRAEINEIEKAVKEGKPTEGQNNRGGRKVRNLEFLADIDNDRLAIRRLAINHGVSILTIQITVHDDLDLKISLPVGSSSC